MFQWPSKSNVVNSASSASTIPDVPGIYRVGNQAFVVGDDGATIAPKNDTVTLLKIATIGDSTAAIGDTTTPANNDTSVLLYAPATSANVSVQQGFAPIALKTLYPAARFVTNCGVSGQTVATMLSNESATKTISTRTVQDAVNNAPDVIIFRGGSINDIYAIGYTGGVMNETNYQTLIANHKLAIARLLTTGRFIIDVGIYGTNQGMTNYPATGVTGDTSGDLMRAAVVRFNNEIKAYVASLANNNIRFLHPEGVISNAGVIKSGYTLLSDGKHLCGRGGLAQAQAEKAVIESVFGRSADISFPGKNLQTNAMFAAHTSNVPTSYAVGGTANCTGSTHRIGEIDGKIWWTREYISSAAGTVTADLRIPLNPTAGGTNPLNVQVGDVYGIEVDVRLENLTTGVLNEVKRIRPRVSLFNAANTYQVYYDSATFDDADNGSTWTGALELHLAPAPIKFNDAAASWGTNSTFDISFGTKALAAGEVIRIGISNPRIVKLA